MCSSTFSLTNPPLQCVVAKMVFAPINKIKDYVDNLQEVLRLKGFRHFEMRKTNAVHIHQDQKGGAKVDFSEEPQWIISDLDRRVSLRLDSNSITILFGKYTEFAQAKPLFEEVLSAIEKHVLGIDCIELQLRYINPIILKEGTGPDWWVRPVVLGMPNFNGLQREASVSETSYRCASGGRLVVRCSSMPKGLTLPPDLLPLEVSANLPLQSEAPFVLLENLHSKKTTNTQFSAATCLEEFDGMRASIHLAFQETVTTKALETWK